MVYIVAGHYATCVWGLVKDLVLSNRGNGWGLAVSGWRLQPTVRVSRAREPSTHVLTPPYIGALWEVARDNI